jgi:energy-coupling factor transporter ATP-binding protein EcfA2
MRRRSEAAEVSGDRSPLSEPTIPTIPTQEVKEEVNGLIQHDVINEIVVIGAALIDEKSRTWLVNRLTPDFFFGKGHSVIWRLLTELEHKKLSFDPATVQQLGGGKVSSDYLLEIIEARPELPQNLKYHVLALEWARTKIEVSRGPLTSLLTSLRNPNSEPDTIKMLSRQVATSFSSGSNKYLRDPEELVLEMQLDIERRQDGIACYPYGVDGLDNYESTHNLKACRPRLTPGCAPGQVTVITGVSGSGKTTFTTHIAISQANQKRNVLFGAWEAGSRMTLELMAIQSLGFSRTSFVEGKITNFEKDCVLKEARRLSEYVRFFELPFGREKGKRGLNDDHLDLIHSYISETGSEIFLADLWRRAIRQLDPDMEELALYRQQAIAVETNCHCILVHQQRLKDIEIRNDKQPTREGLKGSGAWVEVPDTILAVHRPALWKDVPDDTLTVYILKQRHGAWPLAVDFDWYADKGSIKNGRSVDYIHPGSAGDSVFDNNSAIGDIKPNKKFTRRKKSNETT